MPHLPAHQVPNQFVEVNGRLAYRVIGQGIPLLLCVRFRGTMDSWDPLFLDSLAEQGFQVHVFDYSGLGLSGGEPSYDPARLARDPLELIAALGLQRLVLGGWSLGGIAAQLVFLQAPQLLSHLVLFGTTPPGELVRTGEPLFYELARRENDFEDFVHLFFEPLSPESRAAAAQSATRIAARVEGQCPAVPHEWAGRQLGDGPRNPTLPVPPLLDALKRTQIPVLHIGGSHDIVFPVENWHALSGALPTLQLLTLPSSGHGPHLQYPQLCARHLANFVEGEGR
ncbi:alpha/beta hydrolase [Pseudomonas alcaligenes]|uniref:Alpha/beta hydrolase n=1 Tax=Aquipseudomonas alcaligenes TaxID=43263 RepID=A0ABR7S1F3_AQUAC|nr:alpha/beta hydrolase [Pseudomonas alcaligenes]MBC9250879.1 alpha/beta hydrolase [Pseudomonas alcaligenes]